MSVVENRLISLLIGASVQKKKKFVDWLFGLLSDPTSRWLCQGGLVLHAKPIYQWDCK